MNRIENILRRLIGSLKNVDYCQGMNFLVINVYTYLNDEEVSYLLLLANILAAALFV